jgi:4-hydroxybenzoate polyprenyltransferase
MFVDLDGTLIASDLLWESLLRLVREHPRAIFMIPFWLMSGRAHLKRKIASLAIPDVSRLPYRSDVLQFLQSERAQGRRMVLATASDELVAGKVADHLGLFDDRICTSGGKNLKGSDKLVAIETYCRERGLCEFAYVGDSRADLPIWKAAYQIYVVAPSRALKAAVGRLGKPAHVLASHDSKFRPLLRALRPHQWAKNVLIFLPLVLAHLLSDLSRVFATILAFVVFSACASTVYLLNDMLDIEADRAHPKKRFRPFASGKLPLVWGGLLIPLLIVSALGVSWAFLPPLFSAVLVGYLGVNLAYSGWLKRKPIVDVLVLANMYTLRLLAGGVAATVPVSEWLLAFSTFFFLSLAFAKRYSELSRLAAERQVQAAGRGYAVSDLSLIETMGPCSGYMSVMVLALYINSDHVKTLYSHSNLLWGLCGLLLYWISRLWFWAKRGELLEDPVVFALTDRNSLIVAAIGAIVVAAAAWSG